MSSQLRATLAAHVPGDDEEVRHLAAMRSFASTLAEPFSRAQMPAHFTGSAVVLDRTGARVCMVLHAKLQRWLQPGGHAEPEDGGDLARTALREAREETGLDVELHPTAPRPLDVDAHVIPARRDEGEHTHLDVRFAVVARTSSPEVLVYDPNESSGAKWLTWDEALAVARGRTDDQALRRLLSKARALREVTS